MNLNDLIKQGYEIKQGIRKVSVLPNGFKPFNYVQYQLSDDSTYESWKNTVIRFLAKSFPNDISNQQFQKAIEEFENKKSHFAPEVFQKAIGILESLQNIPDNIENMGNIELHPSISITNNNSQSQTQSISVIIDILKDELNGRQLKELKDIIDSNTDEETKRKSLFDKIKSFGSDVAANILANIITNPNIYGSLFG